MGLSELSPHLHLQAKVRRHGRNCPCSNPPSKKDDPKANEIALLHVEGPKLTNNVKSFYGPTMVHGIAARPS